MRIALDQNSCRITPSYSGQKAICPLCNGLVIGKCGEIYNWHWQHHKDLDCDPWQEHETAWHRKWKSYFPIEWQEYIIEKWGIKHRADVRTDKEIVIEFQNSFISSADIRIREEFYGDMVWVVNAEGFKDNFSRRSIVKSHLKNLDNYYRERQSSLKEIYSKDLKDIDTKIGALESSLSAQFVNLNHEEHRKKSLEEDRQNLATYIEDLVGSWGMKYYSGRFLWRLEDLLAPQKQQLRDTKKKVDELQTQKTSLDTNLKLIKKLKSITIEDKEYKIVSFNQLPKDNPALIRIIAKASMDSLFWDIRKINNIQELNAYQYRQQEHVFAVDPGEKMESIAQSLKEAQNDCALLISEVPSIQQEMKQTAEQWFAEEMNKTENEIQRLQQAIKQLTEQKQMFEQRKVRAQEQMQIELKEAAQEDEQEKKTRRFSIMKEKKGLYSYHWAHERKTWQEARQRLFFDFGEEYLFERIEDGRFKKLLVSEFIKQFKTPSSP